MMQNLVADAAVVVVDAAPAAAAAAAEGAVPAAVAAAGPLAPVALGAAAGGIFAGMAGGARNGAAHAAHPFPALANVPHNGHQLPPNIRLDALGNLRLGDLGRLRLPFNLRLRDAHLNGIPLPEQARLMIEDGPVADAVHHAQGNQFRGGGNARMDPLAEAANAEQARLAAEAEQAGLDDMFDDPFGDEPPARPQVPDLRTLDQLQREARFIAERRRMLMLALPARFSSSSTRLAETLPVMRPF